MSGVPADRIRQINQRPVRPEGRHVVYWMTAARRLEWNFGLDRAVERALELDRPLIVLEELTHAQPWASPRRHRFALDGMREHARRLAGGPVAYHPYVEPVAGAGEGLLEALAADACLVVADDHPLLGLPEHLADVGARLPVLIEAIDSNGLLPMRGAGRDFTAAVHFRRHLHKQLAPHLVQFPQARPLDTAALRPASSLPSLVLERWPEASTELLAGEPEALRRLRLPIDAEPVDLRGGREAARTRLDTFLATQLSRYGDDRNHPDHDAASGLSPYLHWGHISVHEIFARLAEQERWSPVRLSGLVTAKREGWWGMSAAAESFLDELVTWRELGFNFAVEHPHDVDRWSSLPEWARHTLDEHAADPRPRLYSLDDLDGAGTDDPIWNAAQRQLRREGRIHNYLRMLWGKRTLEWTPHPEQALHMMIDLNNRYALDGCDPNSYSGIFWVLGRFDRAWKERPIYGKVRYMSSDATRRKLQLKKYLREFGRSASSPEGRGL